MMLVLDGECSFILKQENVVMERTNNIQGYKGIPDVLGGIPQGIHHYIFRQVFSNIVVPRIQGVK